MWKLCGKAQFLQNFGLCTKFPLQGTRLNYCILHSDKIMALLYQETTRTNLNIHKTLYDYPILVLLVCPLGWKPFIILAKRFILDVWQGSEYPFGIIDSYIVTGFWWLLVILSMDNSFDDSLIITIDTARGWRSKLFFVTRLLSLNGPIFGYPVNPLCTTPCIPGTGYHFQCKGFMFDNFKGLRSDQ